MKTRNWEEIPFSLRIIPKGITVAEAPKIANHNATHVYSDQVDPMMAI